MVLPAPDLDDRRFQELVDDAKRMVQQRCPQWTDHNVSDPGVTLIETFAFMVDELFYRLNRVPDRLYVTFLDLLGVTLHPPVAATTDVVLWLSAPQPDPVVVPVRAEVSTLRTEQDEAIVFATETELVIPPRRLAHVLTQAAGADPQRRDDAVAARVEFPAFAPAPQVDDAVLFGLDGAAPSCVVAVRLECEVHGVGVDPTHPPLVWEARDGTGWRRCEVEHDGTGGLNRPGDVLLHVPAGHTETTVGRLAAGWLRCRVVDPPHQYPPYRSSPIVSSAAAFTVGGTVTAVHAATLTDEVLGVSEGVPGQSFLLERHPVVPSGSPFVVEVADETGWTEWTEVDSFAGSSDGDRVVRLDRSTGEVTFPPALRQPDGSLRLFGAVPAKGAPLRVPEYRTGGGPAGNVAARSLVVLRTTVPFVDRVENRRAAHGGVDGETIDEAKERGPLALRTRDRAVTAEDYEQLARRAAPGIARVRCVPARTPEEALGVRVLVVPDAAPAPDDGHRGFEDLIPPDEALAAIATHLDERRPVGARVLVEPPFYQGVTVVAELTARHRFSLERLRTDAIAAVNRYLDPITGGPDGIGWPFGRPVQAGELYAVLQRLRGTEMVDEVQLYPADPRSGRRGEPTQRIELDPHALVFSFDPHVRVRAGA
ncbi:putative baseplate assembly protein [Cellulomonas aerilata]|uniref:Putative baseplate assembly protein n=1 Tax=Cellulomonas aerilata TaxID=515326 RepID=A0A512DA07_9CELL|nr:putative baseplate assembly protein [Cellulomonas aerilata]GEO33285.1 putative baseplate assembly protein [Cellulomonas aerilata]